MPLIEERLYTYIHQSYEANTQIADDMPGVLYGATYAVSAATNATPIRLTTAAHGMTGIQLVRVADIVGNEAANGDWYASVVDTTHLDLLMSQGSGAWSSGGTVQRLVGGWAASHLGIFQWEHDFLPWNVCSTPGPPSLIVKPRHRVRSF